MVSRPFLAVHWGQDLYKASVDRVDTNLATIRRVEAFPRNKYEALLVVKLEVGLVRDARLFSAVVRVGR